MDPLVAIRRASPKDADLLSKLGIETYRETFASGNSEENMAMYLDRAFSLSQLSGELKDPKSVFFLAFKGDTALGYAKLRWSKVPFELEGRNAIELQRIYVHSSAQGTGVAMLLMGACQAEARMLKYNIMWLGVWERNTRAQKFYLRNGFRQFSTHIFQMGNDPQTDWLMMKEL